MKTRVLVAGIGNIFLDDDAFGVEVVRAFARRPLPDGVRVVDFGIRGIDLAYALMEGIELAILVDAMPRGGTPGTLYLLEPEPDSGEPEMPVLMEGHGMNPMRVLALVRSLGGTPGTIRIVGCEPSPIDAECEELSSLSAPVQAAVGEAVAMVEQLVQAHLAGAAERGATRATRS